MIASEILLVAKQTLQIIIGNTHFSYKNNLFFSNKNPLLLVSVHETMLSHGLESLTKYKHFKDHQYISYNTLLVSISYFLHNIMSSEIEY